MTVFADTKKALAVRSWWANALLAFCLYMTIIYLPFDLFYKPLEADQEVWFGMMFTGWAAKLGGLLHWFVYGWGAYGLMHGKSWLWPWMGLYVAQVALSMLLWSLLADRGPGLVAGMIAAAPFIGLAILIHIRPSGYIRVDVDKD
ncbi:MAG: hypothetical protein ISP92_03245 [Pseudomonadales bacterium]|jgi:hypothetical protein|nr:hypothetical protein [Pseudomonadales bacterium]MDA0760208.1 hypothetical protein [Pseudomonadota bacterium]MDA0956702.1 hypothetical protein [Pseudomonadota bacterium]MDA1206201.1 hypothetical protein [Pseudomonadota bacterium]